MAHDEEHGPRQDGGTRRSQQYADQGGGPGGREDRDREVGSGGAAGFFHGGHDQTGNWEGSREDQRQRSGNYAQASYGERRDEHGTFGSRERPNEYPHQGGMSTTGGSQDHRGEGSYGNAQAGGASGYGRQQSPGQQSQPGYGSSEYASSGPGGSNAQRGGPWGAPNQWGNGGQGPYGGERGAAGAGDPRYGSGVSSGSAGHAQPTQGSGQGDYSQRWQADSSQAGYGDLRDPRGGEQRGWGSPGDYARERSEGAERRDYGGSHQGRPAGQDTGRDYRSSQYDGGRGYSSQYGQGGSYGGGIHERDQWGQGHRDQYAQPGQQGQVRGGQQYGYGAARSSDWGREHHESGRQGGYGGVHDWHAGQPQGGQPRDDWRGQQQRTDWQRGYGGGASQYGAGESGPFNPGGFGSAVRSGPDHSQPLGYGEGGMGGSSGQGRGVGGSGYYGSSGGTVGAAAGSPYSSGTHQYGREGAFGQWQTGQGDSWPGQQMQSDRSQSSGQWQSSGTSQPVRRRGPKNYQRSDERLRELISDRLLEDPHIDSSDVSVEVKSGEVILTGTVDDRRTKYQIEELVEQIHGVRDLDNRLKLKRGFLASLFGGGDEHGRSEERSRGDRGSGWTTAGHASMEGPATDQREGSQGGMHQFGRRVSSDESSSLQAGGAETSAMQSGMTTSGSGSQTSASPTSSTTSLTGSTLSGGAAKGERSASTTERSASTSDRGSSSADRTSSTSERGSTAAERSTTATPTSSTTGGTASLGGANGGSNAGAGTSATGGTMSASGVGTEKGASSTGSEKGSASDRDNRRSR